MTYNVPELQSWLHFNTVGIPSYPGNNKSQFETDGTTDTRKQLTVQSTKQTDNNADVKCINS